MQTDSKKSRPIPVIFISHGYVPLYFSNNISPEFISNLQLMGNYLKSVYEIKNIIAISARQCRSGSFYVSSSKILKNVHDHPFEKYYNFDQTMQGNLELSTLLLNLLRAYQIEAQPDVSSTIDSGIWGPLKAMFPLSDFPIVTISVNKNYDGEMHMNLGKLLEEYRSRGSLIICFGGITQNIHQFYEALVDENKVKDHLIYTQFEGWCKKIIETMKGKHRIEKILEYQKHPHYNKVHPTQEHFMPLLVAIGASGSSNGKSFHSQIFKKCMSLSCYIFEEIEILQLSS